jgi:hypothetical protein
VLIAVALSGVAIVAVATIGLGWANLQPSETGPSSTPTPTKAANYWLSDAGIDRATKFREQARLEASRSWVEHVALDPDALANLRRYGVPLTSAEINILSQRAKSIADVRRVTDAFAAGHPEAWAGDYTAGGQLVVVLVDPTGTLSDELGAQIDPGAPFRIRTGRWTLAELTALKERIKGDFWLRNRYELIDLGVNVARNVVELEVSSADPSAPAEIAANFDVGEQLVVTIDGTGVLALPTGTIRGQVQYADGTPATGLVVELKGDIPGAGSTGDVGNGTGDDGIFVFRDVAATGYEVRLFSPYDRQGEWLEYPDWIPVGSKRVEVLPGETTDVVIVVTRP